MCETASPTSLPVLCLMFIGADHQLKILYSMGQTVLLFCMAIFSVSPGELGASSISKGSAVCYEVRRFEQGETGIEDYVVTAGARTYISVYK